MGETTFHRGGVVTSGKHFVSAPETINLGDRPGIESMQDEPFIANHDSTFVDRQVSSLRENVNPRFEFGPDSRSHPVFVRGAHQGMARRPTNQLSYLGSRL